MTSPERYKFTQYQIWNKIGTGINIFFLFITFIFIYVGDTNNNIAISISLLLAFSGVGILFYNDYKHKYYHKITERIIGGLTVIILAAIYWFYQS